MYSKPFVLTLLITSVFGNNLHIHKRDDCSNCVNAASYTDNCNAVTNSVDCLCSDNKFWSIYEDCIQCLSEPLSSVTELRSELCALATNPYYTADNSYYGNDFTNDIYPNYYSYDSSMSSEMATSTMDLESSADSGATSHVISSSTISKASSKESKTSDSQKSPSSTKDQTTKPSSSSKDSKSSESSSNPKSAGSLQSGSSSKSSSSSGDGNILLASTMSITSLLAYILFML